MWLPVKFNSFKFACRFIFKLPPCLQFPTVTKKNIFNTSLYHTWSIHKVCFLAVFYTFQFYLSAHSCTTIKIVCKLFRDKHIKYNTTFGIYAVFLCVLMFVIKGIWNTHTTGISDKDFDIVSMNFKQYINQSKFRN